MKLNNHLFKTTSGSFKYVEAGNGKNLLLLHGLGYFGSTYRDVVERLSERYHVYSPSLHFSVLGQAISSLHEYVRILEDFIRAEEMKDVTVVGHSFGGGVALKLVGSSASANIKRLVLVDSYGLPIRRSFARFLCLFLLKTWHESKYGKPGVLGRIIGDFSLFLVKSGTQLPPMLKAAVALGDDYHLVEKITVPTLLLWGRQDEIFSIKYASRLQQRLSGSRLIVVEGNHDWPLFRPSKIAEIIAQE